LRTGFAKQIGLPVRGIFFSRRNKPMMSAAAYPALRSLVPEQSRSEPKILVAPAAIRQPQEREARSSPTEFLEISFTPLDMDAALDAICAVPPDAPFRYVVTPNVDHVVRLQHRRSDLWPAYRGAWMTLCDSRILAMMARSVGADLPVVAGSDLTCAMFEKVVKKNDRIAILGGRSDLIAKVADRFGLTNVSHYDPPMGFVNNPREVRKASRFLIEAEARYSFLAVGSPQQELVAHQVRQMGGARGIGFCVGASLDFLGGEQERAPVVVQAMALEWLFRLASNPQRMWRRYLVEGPRIFMIHRDCRRRFGP
jgi:N-acetylglucosaminyldiphosphoundecaprenol N-acetyl-beta-D-mannosaminyltransferase